MRKIADKAELRGRRVPPSIAGFETALRDRGHDGIAEALISRHNQRMQRMIHTGITLQQVALPLLASHPAMVIIAEKLGARPDRPPSDTGATWPDHLAWGLDSAVAAVRMILSLQPIGASVIARAQLERWSSNMGSNSGVEQELGEDTTSWLTRLWGQIVLPPGMPPVGDLFGALSELLHGRGPLMPLVWLDVADVADPPSADHIKAIEAISHVLTISQHQLRVCLATAALDRGWVPLTHALDTMPLVEPARSWLPDLRAYIWPLFPSHFHQNAVSGELRTMATNLRQIATTIKAGRTPKQPRELWPIFSFGGQRYRALDLAAQAYQREQQIFGKDFDPDKFTELATEAVLAGEMAAMIAIWLRDNPLARSAADALAVCASGLRSAEWLWLEDDDRAMGCLRCVVEQLARARTWRVKPDRAAKIETDRKSTPRDWIEGAGWKRLSLLNRALGEFAHGSPNRNLQLARHALISLQRDPAGPIARYTGRTHALTALVFIVSAECAAWADTFGKHLGDAYRKVIRLTEAQADKAAEALMNRAWAQRQTPVR